MWGNNRILHILVGTIGVWNPSNLTHIRGLHKNHGEFSHLLYSSSPASSQNNTVVPVVRKDAISQMDYVTWLECITLITPELEVNWGSLVSHKCQAGLVLPFQYFSAHVQNYKLCVNVVFSCRHYVF